MTGEDFAGRAERHRRELHVHCYRMLASFDEAEDAVQETLLRAWRHRDSFREDSLRAWLYRIATNVCLDAIRSRSRRVGELRSFAEVPWLQPYPDRLLDEIAPSDDQPEAVVVSRETIELAFLAALQVLPPRQRAALILRDVLGWTASETAACRDRVLHWRRPVRDAGRLDRRRRRRDHHPDHHFRIPLPTSDRRRADLRRGEGIGAGCGRDRSGPCQQAVPRRHHAPAAP